MMGVQLKKVPLENGNGQGLSVCGTCQGGGVYFEAKKAIRDKKTKEVSHIEKKRLFMNSVSSHLRAGWEAEQFKCTACNGAGMVVKEGK